MRAARFGRLAVLAAGVALAAPALAQADEVTKWNALATSTLVQFPGPGGGAPPALQINMGMVQGAVYDAVNAIERRHRPIFLHKKFHSTASLDAAVATAAYDVLSSLVQDPRAGLSEATKNAMLGTLAAARDDSLGDVAAGRAKAEGIEAGAAAADAMLAERADDGRFGPSPWVLTPLPGHWIPELTTPLLDPTPWVGNVEPFLVKSSSQFRTVGPLALSSPQWATEFNEVKAVGRSDSAVRTPLQTQKAIFWQSTGGPALLWNPVARQLAASTGLGVRDSAFLFALMNLSAADAAINCWNDKYYWDFWRPWNAIRRAETDGNPGTEPDPLWTPLIGAPYPEHPSGHLCLDGALVASMQMFFGTDAAEFDVTSSRSVDPALLSNPRHFSHFSEPLDEIVEARIWAGLHFRTADVQGLELGREVAHWAQIHYFQPLH
jgi:PAP2 superfamily